MTPQEYFEKKVPENLVQKQDKIAGIQGTFEFQLTGPNGGTWSLEFSPEGGKVKSGPSGKADCTVIMEADHFSKMVSGELNPQLAFMTGKLKVQGNMGLALKLGNIL